MITKFLLNSIFYHVGMSWIMCSNKEMLYEVGDSNHPDWFNKSPWYNTNICSKMNGKVFEDFITHTRTERYHIMCSIVLHDKKQPSY